MNCRICTHLLIIMVIILSCVSCSETSKSNPKTLSTAPVNNIGATQVKEIDFHTQIRPILDKKCIACHACYDAPCQLKLESDEGLTRGASKIKVYDGSRLKTIEPTRLHTDAITEAQWRGLGFYSVTNKKEQQSIMQSMLDHGKDNPVPKNAKLSDLNIELGTKRKNSCVRHDELNEYTKEHPFGGMPLAVSGLTEKEYNTMSRWLASGAQVPMTDRQINEDDALQITVWETWLNKPSDQRKIVARYIYEHLILGHLYLQSEPLTQTRLSADKKVSVTFFKLVRSSTPPGKKIEVIATPLPNSQPPVSDFYYRLQAVNETLVYKNHIPYRFDNERLNRYKKLFANEKMHQKELPGYSYLDRSNPFITFSAIPAKARYQFLLEDAEYFVRNFIRGPVCHGPIATSVIRDQFWTMFENPSTELYTNNENYQSKVNRYLGLPGEKHKLIDFGGQWDKYNDDRNQYQKIRQQHLGKTSKQGTTYSQIWNGEGSNKNAFLTVFRHHDSATVIQGWKGDYPLTAWTLDYPLFERTYYELVVGFNVFGSVSHQLQTRLYFDLIRNGSEANFLRFMPPKNRRSIYSNWYPGTAKLKVMSSYYPIDENSITDINFTSNNPKQEFFDYFFDHYPALTQAEDPINRCKKDCSVNPSDDNSKPKNTDPLEPLTRLASRELKKLPAIAYFPEITFLIVKSRNKNTPIKVFSIIRNRIHSSVAFVLGESFRYQEEKDTLTIVPEVVGSYPNLLLSIDESEVVNFVDTIENLNSNKSFNAFIDTYAVKRMQDTFWDELHSVTTFMEKVRPIEAGVIDINRYGYW